MTVLGDIVSVVVFGFFGVLLWSIALDHHDYPAFVLSLGFWMFAIGLPWCATLNVLGMCNWIKPSVVTAMGGPVAHVGAPIAGGLLMLGFAMEAFMTKKPSKKL